MLLESEGGIYSDPDTAALKPVDEWIPPTLTSKVHAVVGIEYDQAEGEVDPGVEGPRLRFCQRIIAASRGHPLISRMVNDVVEGVQALAMEKEMRIAEVRSSDEEVVEFSGSGVWTRAVLETLSEATGSEVSYRNFTEMKEPRFFGDVLVLPVGGFETGQLGEGSLREGSGDALVRHGWKEG